MSKATLSRSTVSALIGFLMCLNLLTGAAGQNRIPETRSISELTWIAGDWESSSDTRAHIEEHWTTAAGASMMGMSRTVVGDKTVEFEYLRIEQRAGGIYYVAHPQARCPGTDFKLTGLTATMAVFENPQHDFPRRIIYRKTGDNALSASIDGGEGTKTIAFEFRRME